MKPNLWFFIPGLVAHLSGWFLWFFEEWIDRGYRWADPGSYHHWAVAPLIILAFVLLIGGFALAAFSFSKGVRR